MASSFRTTRIVIGVVLLVLVGGLLFLDYRLASRTAVSAVVVVLGLWGYVEYGRIARLGERAAGGGPLAFAWGFLGTAYFLTLAWVEGTCGPAPPEFLVGGVALLVLGCFLGAIARSDFLAVFPRLLACLLGVVLFGLLFSYVLRIYHRGEPKEALLRGLVFFLGVKGTDITAYLVGTAVGRTHFLKVSPGKTLEGSTAALLFSAGWFAGAGALWGEVFFEWPLGIASGIILALTSSLGDLSESLIKRYYRVKDSSSLLPEFGGVLDLIDSFLFSGFVFWCLLLVGDSWK